MAKNPSYPPEFRRKIIDLVRAGRPARAVAQEFQLSRQTISNWCKQDDLDSGRRSDGLTSAENEELSRLRKRVRQIEIEHNILPEHAVDSGSTRHRTNWT